MIFAAANPFNPTPIIKTPAPPVPAAPAPQASSSSNWTDTLKQKVALVNTTTQPTNLLPETSPSFFDEHATAIKIGAGVAVAGLVGYFVWQRRRRR